ncbi:MAG: DNA polymerase III subunit epsilon [Alphaproteobacteria bacterium]|nr:DNA polymerase III subunit epsilon [Alphaproteobacteria bacterium]
MREVVLDTETTGLDPNSGHRVIEVGCVELHNHVQTGRTFQRYLNPERDVPAEVVAIHGLDNAFLVGQPRFAAIAEELLAFIGDAPLVAHNAGFDMGFLNAELARLDHPPLRSNRIVDTAALARAKYPGAPASLDALCRRFAVDASARTKHGALLDAQLLAEVYLELMGGRQPLLGLVVAPAEVALGPTRMRPPRAHGPSAAEIAAHAAFIATLSSPIWLQ